jgi:ATP-dependent Clp protease ATP-binding subunit ClpA
MQEIKRVFTPEFRNRLDAIVSFKSLDEEIILRVVDKFLIELESQLQDKKVDVAFSESLRRFLAKQGFDPAMGARPMQRVIQDKIRRALADELLFGRLVNGGRVDIELADDGETVELFFEGDKPPKKPSAGRASGGGGSKPRPKRKEPAEV